MNEYEQQRQADIEASGGALLAAGVILALLAFLALATIAHLLGVGI